MKVANEGYAKVLAEIEAIMDELTTSKEVETMFNYYAENVVNSDEAAAILTLAEILKTKEKYSKEKIEEILDKPAEE